MHHNCPEDGFGVSQIYQQVPPEDEADELGLRTSTEDGYDGEDTYEQGWDEIGEDTQ